MRPPAHRRLPRRKQLFCPPVSARECRFGFRPSDFGFGVHGVAPGFPRPHLTGGRRLEIVHPMKTVLTIAALFTSLTMFAASQPNLASIPIKDIKGKDTSLKEYQGKVLLVVNVASKCGYTPQYSALEAIHRKYSEKGFAVLGFPCNDFGSQEPGSNEEIQTFCH